MKKKDKKPFLGRIPISKVGGSMKDKSKYNRKRKHTHEDK